MARASVLWLESMHHIWRLEKAARLNELRGRYVKRMNDSGIHDVSLLWGKVQACEAFSPHLAEVGSYPTELRSRARRAAEGAFREEIMLGLKADGEVEV